jgi:hypothetical protein
MISKFIAKVVGEKGQWRQYQARARQLPASYRYPKGQWIIRERERLARAIDRAAAEEATG